MDPPRRETDYTLTNEVTDLGETIVTVSYHCQSELALWNYLSGVWHFLFLICATVLAFQMRGLKSKMNETQVLAMMTYSHFVFVVLRVITFLLEGSDVLSPTALEATRSLIYSLDTILAILIYFVPKFLSSESEYDDTSRTANGHVFALGDAHLRTSSRIPSSADEGTTPDFRSSNVKRPFSARGGVLTSSGTGNDVSFAEDTDWHDHNKSPPETYCEHCRRGNPPSKEQAAATSDG